MTKKASLASSYHLDTPSGISKAMATSSIAGSNEKDDYTKAEVGSLPSQPHAAEVVAYNGPFGKLLGYLADNGVEARGLERVPESERKPQSGLQILFFWFSVNMSFSALATGGLGAVYFELDFKTSVAIIWCMAALGCLTTAWVATLGPVYGLRTMALSRFAGGVPGTFIFSILNILTQLSYSVTNALAGGQALHAVNGRVSLIVGIVLVSVIVFVLSIFGLHVVQKFERYCWIACFIIYCIVLGLGTKGDYDVNVVEQAKGASLAGGVLSFAGIMFSVSSGWTVIASDYVVGLPSDTPKKNVFFFTFFGTFLPIVFTCTTSAAFQTITKPEYVAAFQANSLGGIVGAILGPVHGFGKFCLVVLSFSTIAANVPNTYSGALCMQSLAPIMMKIPRVIYVCLFTAIYLVASIVGREHFSDIVSNFAALLSYWTAFFVVILFLEFVWFRRQNGELGPINPDDFNDYKKLPPGYACVGSIACAIGGIVPSMAETYYIGPIAKLVEPLYGGDLGFEASLIITTITFFIFRTIEIKVFKR